MLVSLLLLACAAVGAGWTAYAVYTICRVTPNGADIASMGLRAHVTLEWPRALGFVVPMAVLTFALGLGSVEIFVHREALARGPHGRPLSPGPLLIAQSALVVAVAALFSWGVACLVAGAEQDDMVVAAALWLPSFALAATLAFVLHRRPLRPSLRRAVAAVAAAAVLGGVATIAQAPNTSDGQPLLQAGFHQVSFSGTSSVQFMEVSCANGRDCTGAGFGTFGKRLPNGRAMLAVSTNGARTWHVALLPPQFAFPNPPTCNGNTCWAVFGGATTQQVYRVVRVAFPPAGPGRITYLGASLPARGSLECHGDDCMLTGDFGSEVKASPSRTLPAVWRSSDGGRHWERQLLPIPAGTTTLGRVEGPWCNAADCSAAVLLAPVGCRSSGLSGRCSPLSEMLYTTDWGRTWSVGARNLPMANVACSPGGVCTGTTEHPVSRYRQELLLAVSGDFGRTWTRLRTAPYGSEVTCWTIKNCVATRETNVVLVSSDSGMTWSGQAVLGTPVDSVFAAWCDALGECVAAADDSGQAAIVTRSATSAPWSAALFPRP